MTEEERDALRTAEDHIFRSYTEILKADTALRYAGDRATLGQRARRDVEVIRDMAESILRGMPGDVPGDA